MASISKSKRVPRIRRRVRVRRGSAEDAERLRQDLLAAAMRLFTTEGIDGLSMRAIAQKVGVSPMTPYRYFEDKAALLRGLWQFSLTALHERLVSAVIAKRGGRARQRAFFVAYLDFWESNPDHFWLVYLTQGIKKAEAADKDSSAVPIYRDLLSLLRQTTHELADEIGAKRTWAKLSEDVTFAMLLGYLEAVLVNHRYPWGDLAELRAAYVEQLMICKEQCLLRGRAPAIRPSRATGNGPRRAPTLRS
jgi:AcrR family transcriptional regulator